MNTTIRITGAALLLAVSSLGTLGCRSGAAQRDNFSQAGDRAPTPRTLHMMAKLLNENGRAGQAEYVLSKILEQNPEYLPAYVELADIQIRQQRFSDATATLERAHALAPNDPVLANNLGVLLLRGGQYDTASNAFTAAVNADPDEARYRANLALSFALNGNYEDAYTMYTTILPPASAYWNLGVVSEARQDAGNASEFFARANLIKENKLPETGFEAVTVSVPVP